MGKFLITSVNVAEIQLENILLMMEHETFGKDLSARIVGGVRRLEYLVSTGEIQAEKPCKSQNGKWYCNAAQVLRHCRNMRGGRRR